MKIPQRIAKKKTNGVPVWGVKLTYRLSQITKQVGEYDFKLRVAEDGTRFVSVDGVKWERL